MLYEDIEFILMIVCVLLAVGFIKIWRLCSDIQREIRDLRKDLTLERTCQTTSEPKPGPDHKHEPKPEPSHVPPPLPETSTPVPPPLPVRRERSETALGQLWRRIWNWIVVGEDYRKEGVPMEVAVATNWLVRIGVLVVVAGIGFFLDYTADRGWLGPLSQLALAFLVGTAALYGGAKLLGKTYHLLAQGFLGLGIATWYGTVFAAQARFHLIGETLMFAGLCAVTFAAATLSVKIRSLLIGILSILGGYALPFLISGEGPLTGLVVYVLMLGILVVVISKSMDWPLLTWMGLLGHLALVVSLLWFPTAPVGHLLVVSTGGFLIYSAVPLLMLFQHTRKATLFELGFIFVNAGGYFLAAYEALHATPDWSRALLTAGLCVFHAGTYVWYQTKSSPGDRTLLVSFLGLSIFFGTLTPPQLLEGLNLTVVWSLLAGVLMGMAGWMPSRFLRRVGIGLHTLVVVRLVIFDYASVYLGSTADIHSFEGFLKRLLLFGLPIVSLFASMKLLRKGAVDKENLFTRRWIGSLLFLTCLSFYQLEVGRSLSDISPSLEGTGHLLGWILAGGLLLKVFSEKQSVLPGLGLMVSFAAGGWLLLLGDSPAWRNGYEGQVSGLAVYRWIDFMLLFGFMLAAYREFSKDLRMKGLRNMFGYGALLFLFGFTSREVVWFLNTYLTGSAEGGLSVYWAAFALALVSAGLLRRLRSLRLAGLILFAITAGKIILVDLAGVDPLYRILAFLLLGALLLAGAFVYLRFQDKIMPENKSG